jgi:ASPIC and UnbV
MSRRIRRAHNLARKDHVYSVRNDVRGSHHWRKAKLVGTKSNRGAIGARVLVHNGKREAQAAVSQASFYSANDPRFDFGLGAETAADIEIRWPNGQIQKLKAVSPDRLVTRARGRRNDSQQGLAHGPDEVVTSLRFLRGHDSPAPNR